MAKIRIYPSIHWLPPCPKCRREMREDMWLSPKRSLYACWDCEVNAIYEIIEEIADFKTLYKLMSIQCGSESTLKIIQQRGFVDDIAIPVDLVYATRIDGILCPV